MININRIRPAKAIIDVQIDPARCVEMFNETKNISESLQRLLQEKEAVVSRKWGVTTEDGLLTLETSWLMPHSWILASAISRTFPDWKVTLTFPKVPKDNQVFKGGVVVCANIGGVF